MLVSAYFSLKSEDRLYVFNPHNVVYIDPVGVLFAKDVYRQFAPNEYENLMTTMNSVIDNVNT